MSTETLRTGELTTAEKYVSFMLDHRPGDIDEYYKERQALAFTGQPTWIVRQFEEYKGHTFDLFVRQIHFATTVVDADGAVSAYVNHAERNKPAVMLDKFASVDEERNFVDAVERIEALLPTDV